MTISDDFRWNIAEAKARFSEVVAQSARAPQIIEKRGEPVSVLISFDDFKKMSDSNGRVTGSAWREFCRKSEELRAELRKRGLPGLRIQKRRNRPNPFEGE